MLMDVVSVPAVNREHSPASAADVNFNSPGHRSSQDGSFIQDEDMQLILELGAKSLEPKQMASDTRVIGGVLSESWMNRHAKWAIDFDANVAELDFDHFSSRDIRTLRKLGYDHQLQQQQQQQQNQQPADDWDSLITKAMDVVEDCNQNKIRTAPCNSLEVSLALSANSLFSSAELPVIEQAFSINRSMPAFISTDSLDMSTMVGKEDLLKAVCTTNKRDYMLTFDRAGVLESGVGGLEETEYQDARLSDAIERSICGLERSGIDDSSTSQSSFITWDRVKRSYETRPYIGSGGTKFNSLPNLNGYQRGCSSMECGGGEHMLSPEMGSECVPLYELKSDTSMNDSSSNIGNNDVIGAFSLLQAFKTKLSCASDKLALPSLRLGVQSSDDSSGYMTGTGSQQGNGSSNAKTKQDADLKSTTVQQQLQQQPQQQMQQQRQQTQESEQQRGLSTDDYDYAEFYVNGRYIDLNHNEIGFVPPSTRGVQMASSTQNELPAPTLTSFHQQAAIQKAKNSMVSDGGFAKPPAKPPRTFATLLERDFSESGGQQIQQRPERAPYGRRILPKIPDESQANTEISRMKDSATQVPIYVVDQAVQTAPVGSDDRTGLAKSYVMEDPIYVGRTVSLSPTPPQIYDQKAKLDWRKQFFGTPAQPLLNMPDLNFLKFPFIVPNLFPHVPPFPMAFLAERPDVSSLVAQQAKLANASVEQLAAPKLLLPQPPLATVTRRSTSAGDCSKLMDVKSVGGCIRRDSGLGVSGPSHVQDWESLATLLPNDVLQAYSLFKAHSDFLGKSTSRADLNIDKIRRDDRAATSGRAPKINRPFRTCRRFGRKHQRPLSEPAFKNKKFDIISEEQECGCEEMEQGRRSRFLPKICYRCGSMAPSVPLFAQCSGAAGCCRASSICCQRNSRCCHRRSMTAARVGHVCSGDTDDTEDEENCETRCAYRPFNRQAEKVGGRCDDERLMNSSEDDDELICTRSMKTTKSEYTLRDPAVCVPTFLSAQNVCGMSQFGFPLKKLRPTDLAFRSDEATDAIRPCATCYRVRSPSLDLTESGSLVLTDTEEYFCDCQTSDIIEELQSKKGFGSRQHRKVRSAAEKAAAARRYQQKRELVQCVVSACQELMSQLAVSHRPEPWKDLSDDQINTARALIRYSLCPAVERLLADGLIDGKSVWEIVLASATLGPATKSIHELVSRLDNLTGTLGERSLLFILFVNGLLSLRSLDCWLSYLTLKDKILIENYKEHAFLRKSTTSYKALFQELLTGIQPLSLAPFDQLDLDAKAFSSKAALEKMAATISSECSPPLSSTVSLHKEIVITFRTPDGADDMSTLAAATLGNSQSGAMCYSLVPARLPNDSRIPKSSSVPSRMCERLTDLMKKHPVISTKTPVEDRSPMSERLPAKPSRIPILKNSRSCPDGRRRVFCKKDESPVSNISLDSTTSTSAMSITASTFSELDGPDVEYSVNDDLNARYVYAIDDHQNAGKGQLTFAKGDTLLLLRDLGAFLQCKRDDEIGLAPRKKVTYVTFL